MKHRLMKNLLLPVLLMILIVAFTACSIAGSQENLPGGNDTNYGTEADSEIPKPAVPDTNSHPVIEFPDVDETGLIGNADITSAKAIIILKGTSAEITGTGAAFTTAKEYDIYNSDGIASDGKITYGTVVEITESGTYVLQGTLNPGFVAVSKKDLSVTLVLNGVNIYCENYSAIVCLKKSDITIELAEGSTNYLTDGGVGIENEKYMFAFDKEEQPNATLIVRNDLMICGSGKLIVNSGLNNGIGTRANLTITGGDITVYAINNAIKGNDSISINGGKFSLVSDSDGVKTESTDDGLGYINISGGEFLIYAVNDAVQAATNLTISNTIIKMKTGGGSHAAATADSAKGLKAANDLVIHSGTFDIDTNDDCIHSNGTVIINSGTFTIASADDGIHADELLTINGGIINISKCYEGLEAYDINLNGGYVRLKATDDGVNVATGNDGSAAMENRPGQGGFRPGQQGGGTGGQEEIIDGTLTITGGEYHIESTGDGLDSNGKIAMSGGTVVVFGPTQDPDVPVDFDNSFIMTGGTLIALGYFGNMAQQPSSGSTQYSFMAKFSGTVSAGSILNVSTSSGTGIVTLDLVKNTKGIVLCSPLLGKGSYTVSSGGSHSGTADRLGIYSGGLFSGGTVQKTFTISSTATTIN